MLNTLAYSIFALAGLASVAAMILTIRDCAPALRRLFREL